MSASWDRNQGYKFYFGNAAVDLADQLPADDFAPEAAPAQPTEVAYLLETIESQIAQITAAQNELSFLLSDLTRMLK